MRGRAWIAASIVLLVLGLSVASFVRDAGLLRRLEPHSAGRCTVVTGLVGAEDLSIDQDTGIAYISAYDRRASGAGRPVAGALYAYDLTASRPQLVNLTPHAGPDFLPHGLSLYRAPDGSKTLFVINHGNGEHSIEIFDVRDDALSHRATIRGDALVSPNDVVGVGPRAFYVTNDHANVRGFMRTLEDYLRLRLSAVYYYDGQEFTRVISGVGGANGINVTPDARTLYLAAASESSLHVYDRDISSGRLTERTRVALEGFPDNVELMKNGDLLVGIHSKVLQLVEHMRSPAALAPSHIVRLSPDGASYRVETIYLDLGEQISGASVAAAYGDRLLIGSIFEPHILDCRGS